jgi:flagellin
MRINHNIAALNSYRQLSTNQTLQGKSLEKLSSGLRINKAGDDAAGLAISEKMRSQIRGLDQASRNAQDGISMIQTAEGALSETHSILQRMRELSVQSSSDTNTADDRAELQKEMDQLIAETDRISSQTEFNSKKLLNGSAGITGVSTEPAKVDFVSATDDTIVGTYAIKITTAAVAASATGNTARVDLSAAAVDMSDVADTLVINGHTVDFSGAVDDSDLQEDEIISAINAADSTVEATINASHQLIITNRDKGATALTVTGTGAGLATLLGTDLTETAGVNAVVTVDGANSTTAVGTTVTFTTGSVKGMVLTADGALNNTASVTVTSAALSVQVGASAGQTISIAFDDMGADKLGTSGGTKIDAVDVTTQSGASAAITVIDNAIKQVSAQRSKLGAFQNRLEHTINNLGTSAENLTAAESRIRDVDMAKEMMEFTKNNILQQAATAMLAQANQSSQGVLQLLR